MANRIVNQLAIDEFSVKKAIALLPIEDQKKLAQRMREHHDWYGKNMNDIPLRWVLDVIHITDPNFETVFTPAI